MIEWIILNWATIVEGGLALIGFASIVVKLTPNKKDDELLGKIKNFISKWIALNQK